MDCYRISPRDACRSQASIFLTTVGRTRPSIEGKMSHETTFANDFAETIGPLLIAIRTTGFFEAHVFIPLMTVASILLFIGLNRIKQPTSLISPRWLWLIACYGLCFLATNVTAVAFKTLIIEELDYENTMWFESLVGPLHFYIVSVVIAYLLLIFGKTKATLSKVLCIYIQVGLIGGYAVALYRIFNEPISLFDLTSGMSGFINIAWFGFYNVDIVSRFRYSGRAAPRPSQQLATNQ